MKSPEGIKLISLRVPVGLSGRIEADAKREKRSLNAHLNFLIEEHLDRDSETSEAAA